MTKDEALKLALEALQFALHVGFDESSERQIKKGDKASQQHRQAITAIKEALAQPEQTNTRPYYTIDELNAWADEKEKQAWRNAAIRIGEELSSVGPDGYYDMDAWKWLDWAMEQEPRGKNSLAQPEQEPDYSICPTCGGMASDAIVPKSERFSSSQPSVSVEQEPMAVDKTTMELAESVGLIGPASRSNDLHGAIQRFHDLICVNATIKAAQMAADVIQDTTPPQRKPLSDEEIEDIAIKSQDGITPHDDTLRFARAIEAALRSKNT